MFRSNSIFQLKSCEEKELMFFFFLQAREPKAIMKINSVNATFQPAKIGTAHGLQITYLKDNSTRNIFVYHEDGKVRFGASLPFYPAPPKGKWGIAIQPEGMGIVFSFYVCLFF